MMFRQGDVLLIPTKDRPARGEEPIKRDRGWVVLAYGELTGHAHAIEDDLAELYERNDDRLLVLKRAVMLVHEEHRRLKLPAGNYIVRQQCEYAPEEVRRVAD